jgi:type II secretory ATPase GspE/PulE/Tfp pilus assembly ATPase PilB-like protein
MASPVKRLRPMNHIIPILPPPAARPDVENAVTAGEAVEVELRGGTCLCGTLQKFLKQEKRLVLRLEDGAPREIAFSTLTTLRLPRPRNWAIERRALTEERGPEGTTAQSFEVTLKSGEELRGVTLGYRVDAAGLYLYPVDGSTYTHTFIPHVSIERRRFAEYPLDEEPGPPAAGSTDPEKRGSDEAEIPAERETRQPIDAIETPEQLEEALKYHKAIPKLKLGEILVREKIITQEQLDEALARQRAQRDQGITMQLGQVLMALGTIDMEEMLGALAKKLGIPFLDLDKFKMNPEAIRFVPGELASRFRVVPVHFFDNKLVIALENPTDWEALDAVRFHTNLNIETVMAAKSAIDRMIGLLYSEPGVQGDSLEDYLPTSGEGEDDDEPEQEYSEASVQDNVIVRLVNKIIIDAYQQGASDIHIEPYPGRHKTVVRIRKDGSLRHYYDVPGKMRNALVARIKVMADLDISEKRKPQDGKIDFKRFGPLKIELRVATVPTAGEQEDVVMRILSSGEPVPLDKLGLSERNAETLRRLVQRPYGLFFVCGPTGSGKTTTLHSILGYLNTQDRKIWTAEDPVEITQRGLRQVLVKPKIGLTFAAAMRAFLRADPDIIMVGEMRDKETTSIGIEASLTGHLVLSTLHTNTAPETVTRLLDMGMDPFNFADALIGVLAQRLAKRLCSTCKVAYTPAAGEIDEILTEYCYELLPHQATEAHRREVHERVLQEWRDRFFGETPTLYRAKGCTECDGSGYKGRIGIHELMVASETLKKNILEQATVADLFEIAIGEGMRTLKQDGIEKVLQGHTDMHMIRTVCVR